MISVSALKKNFGAYEAVKQISFSIGKGEVVALLGPNGAGKTTTMRMLTGFYEPSSGTATVGGHDVQKNRKAVQALIGYLPESASSYPDMLVSEFLEFIAESREMEKEAAAKGIAKAVKVTDLGKYLYSPIMHLSKGYKQRVGLAAALLHDPQVLILDEPTSGLDPNQINEIRQLIRELSKEKTIILSTHILKEVEDTCERAIIISDGRIVLDEKLEKIQRMKEGRETWEFALKGNQASALGKIQGLVGAGESVQLASTSDAETRFNAETTAGFNEKLFALCVSEKWVLRELFMQKQSIEDVFARLTAKNN
ncbi:MAG: ATP-binding cassette domain-containing protein [Turneriella sp.]|nr:ATP-binding cassette domain-containing protein [Turneriella sp.]